MSKDAEAALVVVRQLPTDELALEIANTALELAMAAKAEAVEDRKALEAMSERVRQFELILGVID
jgi:replication-associated recombination protein RarA